MCFCDIVFIYLCVSVVVCGFLFFYHCLVKEMKRKHKINITMGEIIVLNECVFWD